MSSRALIIVWEGVTESLSHLESAYLETRTRDGRTRKMFLTVPDDSAFADILDDPTQDVQHEILHASTVIREEIETRVEDKSDLGNLIDNLLYGLIVDTIQFTNDYSSFQERVENGQLAEPICGGFRDQGTEPPSEALFVNPPDKPLWYGLVFEAPRP